jgi:hypothetical protein
MKRAKKKEEAQNDKNSKRKDENDMRRKGNEI